MAKKKTVKSSKSKSSTKPKDLAVKRAVKGGIGAYRGVGGLNRRPLVSDPCTGEP